MRLTPLQMQKLSEKVLEKLKKQNVVIFKEDEKKVFDRIFLAVKQDYQKEIDLERDVHKMMEDLERQHSGEFQRSKMFPLLKNKLAKERKIIL